MLFRSGGILNGSVGTLKKIRYYVDANGDRHLRSCVVEIPDSNADSVPGLGAQEFPILEETKRWTRYKKKRKLTLDRTQVPIQPAYAFTCHRAQGQTFSHVIVDLKSCPNTESAYVMLSRATSIDGVRILRPFALDKITTPSSKDLLRELARLRILDRRTHLQTSVAAKQAEVDSAPSASVPRQGEDENLYPQHTLSVGGIPDVLERQCDLLRETQDDIARVLDHENIAKATVVSNHTHNTAKRTHESGGNTRAAKKARTLS